MNMLSKLMLANLTLGAIFSVFNSNIMFSFLALQTTLLISSLIVLKDK